MHTILASRIRIIRSATLRTPREPPSKVSRTRSNSDFVVGASTSERAESPRPSTSKGIGIHTGLSPGLLVPGKIGRQIFPQGEPQYQNQFLSPNDGNSSNKESFEKKDKCTLSVIGSPRCSVDSNFGGSVKRESVFSKVDDPNLWCKNSTEECFSTCVTADFFIATMKSAWIVIVLLLYFKISLIAPNSGSLLDYISDENVNGTNTSTFAICEKIYKLDYSQKKPLLIAILIMGFPILPLELYLTKMIFYAIEMRNRTHCKAWLVCRIFLTVMFILQAFFKLMCFTFESFDLATIPEIIYRFFEIHVAKIFIEKLKEGLP